MFSGSYDPADTIFLMQAVEMPSIPVAEKERLIRSGARHYSEMLSRESLPAPDYLELFHAGWQRHRTRFATDLIRLARQIAAQVAGPITLLSLARAGTPVGAILKRTLTRWGRSAVHYSISLIRDRGLDEVALRFVLERHAPESLVFVDGWTGKGVMARELWMAEEQLWMRGGGGWNAGLHVVADLSGTAAVAATSDDYLIPSSLLGATISGLVSRSVLTKEIAAGGGFHGCVFYEEFAAHDLSRWFLDAVTAEIERIEAAGEISAETTWTQESRERQRAISTELLERLQREYGIDDPNYVKPGIGETTRALLRRGLARLLVREGDDPEVAHLQSLAARRAVPVTIDASLPYRAVALLHESGD